MSKQSWICALMILPGVLGAGCDTSSGGTSSSAVSTTGLPFFPTAVTGASGSTGSTGSTVASSTGRGTATGGPTVAGSTSGGITLGGIGGVTNGNTLGASATATGTRGASSAGGNTNAATTNGGSTNGNGASTSSMSTGTSGTTGAGGVAQFCNSFIGELATYESTCLGGPVSFWQADFNAQQACQQLEAGVENGHITFISSSASTCLTELSALPCTSAYPAACNDALQGTMGTNGPCYQAEDCVAGNTCSLSNLTCPGTCQALAIAGQPCTEGALCDANDVCLNGLCEVAPAKAGPGQLCDPSVGCVPPYECSLQLTDAGAPVVYPDAGFATLCVAFVQQGQPCQSLGAPCTVSTYCGLDGTCVPLPQNGEPCGVLQSNPYVEASCYPGLYCTAGLNGAQGGVCAPQLSPGDPCSSSVQDAAQCGEGTCTDSLCVARCSEP